MIKLNIDIKVNPQKLPEFLQTLDQLLIEMRNEEGNLIYRYQQNKDEITKILIEADWKSWENLEHHLRGRFFAILLGALRVLCGEPAIKINDDANHNGTDSAKRILKEITES